jgi:ribosomal protein S10
MDKQGFRILLQSYKLLEKQIKESITIAERFEAFVNGPGRTPSADTAWAFSQLLIEEGKNTEDNYIALIRYCRLIKNNEMFIALLELVDGGEVSDNLYRMVSEEFGAEIRNEVFKGIEVAPYGTPSPIKPAYMHPVIKRLEARVGNKACKEFLSASLRDLPDEYFLTEREKFQQAGNLDAYLHQRKEAFMARLEECLHTGRLFFAQEISGDVLDFVRSNPEMGGGKREGNIIYETKIPYMTKQYLAETDLTLRRYYACHCPWARDAVKNGNVELAEIFCQCSGGFHKKPFEVIFEQPLKVEVLESILKGDSRCRFAIYLPEEVVEENR